MKDKNSRMNGTNCNEDECGSIKNNNNNSNFDFECEFDIDKADECFINDMGNIDDGDCEELYQEGFEAGYEKAKQEVLAYMKKNKCCIRCKLNCNRRSTKKQKHMF